MHCAYPGSLYPGLVHPLQLVISNMQLLHISNDKLTGDQNGALQCGSVSMAWGLGPLVRSIAFKPILRAH